MKTLEIIIIMMAMALVWLLYREYTRNSTIKIERMNASEAGIQMDSTGIIFSKPVRFDSTVTANQNVTANNLQVTDLKTNTIDKVSGDKITMKSRVDNLDVANILNVTGTLNVSNLIKTPRIDIQDLTIRQEGDYFIFRNNKAADKRTTIHKNAYQGLAEQNNGAGDSKPATI